MGNSRETNEKSWHWPAVVRSCRSSSGAYFWHCETRVQTPPPASWSTRSLQQSCWSDLPTLNLGHWKWHKMIKKNCADNKVMFPLHFSSCGALCRCGNGIPLALFYGGHNSCLSAWQKYWNENWILQFNTYWILHRNKCMLNKKTDML